jgi:hypothetical protein
MKPCSFRRQSSNPERVICLNTKQIKHTGTVSKLICEDCYFARIISYEEQCSLLMSVRDVCSVCEEVDTVPVNQQDKTWCVVITTAPRPIPTIKRTIASVRMMHLEPIIFAEPDSIPVNAKTFTNETRKGVWDNWRQAAKWAIDNTTADKILMLQDDVTLHPQTKRVIEPHLWPSGNTGFVSLYTPAHYQTKKPIGLHRVRTSALWGACAMIWERNVLQEVLDHSITAKWLGVAPSSNKQAVMERRKANRYMIQNSDTAIGHIMNAMGREMWFVTPSPATHIATTSAINHGGNKGKRNCRYCADPKKSLKSQLTINSNDVPTTIEPTAYDLAVRRCTRLGMAPTFGVSKDMWFAIKAAVKPGMTTAEFGSGVSTFAFSEANHTAYEQDRKWTRIHKSIKESKLVDNWYSGIDWLKAVPNILLIDGPHGKSRLPAYSYAVAVLNNGGTVFIDDTTREDVAELCAKLEENGATVHHNVHHDKSWCTVTMKPTLQLPSQES